MGSLPEGTLCAYCRTHEAGYIPDGAIGPLCMGEPHCCFDRAQILGWGVIEEEYIGLVKIAWRRLLGRHIRHITIPLATWPPEIAMRVYRFLWRV